MVKAGAYLNMFEEMYRFYFLVEGAGVSLLTYKMVPATIASPITIGMPYLMGISSLMFKLRIPAIPLSLWPW